MNENSQITIIFEWGQRSKTTVKDSNGKSIFSGRTGKWRIIWYLANPFKQKWKKFAETEYCSETAVWETSVHMSCIAY